MARSNFRGGVPRVVRLNNNRNRRGLSLVKKNLFSPLSESAKLAIIKGRFTQLVQRVNTMAKRARIISTVVLMSFFIMFLLHADIASAGVMYTVTDLGTLGGTQSVATGINNAGQVVGWSYIAGNSNGYAFLGSPPK